MNHTIFTDETINMAIDYLNNWLHEKCNQKSLTLNWIGISPQINLSGPCFQHLCFRLNNSAFSCNISIYDSSNCPEEIGQIIPTPQMCSEEERLHLCKINDLIPCTIAVDLRQSAEPIFMRGLSQIDIFSIAQENIKTVNMSEYEIKAVAMRLVINMIDQTKLSLQSFTDIPSIEPCIYCSYGSEKYAIVLSPYIGDRRPKIKDIPYREIRSGGSRVLVAPVGLIQDDNSDMLVRGADILTNYSGELFEVRSVLGFKIYSRFWIPR